ncbi:MAG: hypothetical protein J0L87_01190 [Bacteroidetes bacterium]|nr:hypothetical protein [Bacteroidota bacterium]
MQSNRSFFLQLGIFSLFTLAVLLLWNQYASLRFQSNLTWAIWGFFILTTALIHLFLVGSSEKEPKKFVVNFMLVTAVKLFGYLIIILVYALLKREAAMGFTIFFLTMYLLYSGFEVFALLKHFRK